MMSQPGDQVTGAWGLRAAHADRERAVDMLKGAFVQGRLTKDEFDARVSRALAARTCAELTAITAIPVTAGPVTAGPVTAGPVTAGPVTAGPVTAGPVTAGPVTAGPPHQRGQAPTPTDQAITWSTAATFVAVTLVTSMFLLPQYFLLVAGFVFGIVFATAAQLLYSRHEKRSRGALPG
jgi:hypothetical protein